MCLGYNLAMGGQISKQTSERVHEQMKESGDGWVNDMTG